jgi:hypothetical protein
MADLTDPLIFIDRSRASAPSFLFDLSPSAVCHEFDFDTVMEPHLTKSEMAQLFLIQGETKETDFPLSPELIAKYQRKDKTLKNKIQKGLSNNYSTTKVEG